MDRSFETFAPPSDFYTAILPLCLAALLFVFACYCLTRFFKLRVWSKTFANTLYMFGQTFKLTTCVIAIFFVFFFDFENKHICIMPIDKMLLSTFLVGALAVWELVTMFSSFVKLIEEIED